MNNLNKSGGEWKRGGSSSPFNDYSKRGRSSSPFNDYSPLFPLKQNQTSDKVRGLLQDYIASHDDWKEYCFFSSHSYSRNCVNRNEVLELIVLCWGEGQETSCHNHPSVCWLSVLQGEMVERRYVYEDTGATVGSSGLVNEEETILHSLEVGYIDDGIALHSLGSRGGKSISLHVYSPPVDQCNIYDITSGKVSQRTMRYHSLNKTLRDFNH